MVSATKPLPLAGVRIVDFSRLLPGPFATQMMGEMGADVIKVEQPGIGDGSRHAQPRYKHESVYFHATNAHKRSIALDMKNDAGREVARRLLKDADVVIESFRPGVAKKLAIDHATVSAYNPRVIHCAISGFGQTGPLSHIAGHDLVIQGLTGLMGCALEEQNPPPVPGFQSADFAGSLYCVIGVQAALAQRAKTGVGCEIDLAMFEALYNMCLIPLSSAFARDAGHSGEPRLESFGGNPRYATYLSKDGKPIAVSLLETRSWVEFCNKINRPDLISKDETPAHRLSAHVGMHATYHKGLTEYCAQHTSAEIMRQVEETGIAICPVCDPQEAMDLTHVKARGAINHIEHPAEGRIPHLVNPLARAGLARGTHAPAPALGQHSREILLSLGYSSSEAAALMSSGVVVGA